MLGSRLIIAFAIQICFCSAACANQQSVSTDLIRAAQEGDSAIAGSGGARRANSDAAADIAGQIATGREIAIRDCFACHAIDAGSVSPNPDAPPLNGALSRFKEDALANHLIEAIRIGHGAMPLFDLDVIAADALIAYLRSIGS